MVKIHSPIEYNRASGPVFAFAMEVVSLVLPIIVASFLYLFHVLSIHNLIAASSIFLIFLIVWSWKQFDGGRHPCWLLLITMVFFQGGTLIASFLGEIDNPFTITQLGTNFDIEQKYEALTLLAIAIAIVSIYLPCRYNFSPKQLIYKAPEYKIRCVYFLFILLIPFELYKNFRYIGFVWSHGGYIAGLVQHDELLASVPGIVRYVSFIGRCLFLIILLIDGKKERIKIAFTVFFLMSAPTLLLGGRGAFFSVMVMVWYFYKLKFKGRFNLLPLLVIGIIGAIIALVIQETRQGGSIVTLNLLGFLATQGATMQVTELAIRYKHIFSQDAIKYLFSAISTAHVLPDFASDLSLFLNPDAFRLKFGTGASYVAEAYLLGGLFGVFTVSFAIGIFMRWLHSKSSSLMGGIIMILLLPSVIYLPRNTLLGLIGEGIRYGAGMILAWLIVESTTILFGAFILRDTSKNNDCAILR